jgi:hypothetical protein
MWGLLLHIQKNEALVSAHMVFDFEIHSGTLELGNVAHLLLASMVSVAVPQMSRDMNHIIV